MVRTPRNKKKLAIGPQLPSMPSWNWVGADTAEEMKKYYDVTVFGSNCNIPDCDYLMLVKQPLRKISIQELKKRKIKTFYCPIDFYHNSEQLTQDRIFLQSCDGILTHCERWIPYFHAYNKNVHFVEHHGKYTLSSFNEYKKDGFVLWIGSFQYIPFLLDYIKKNNITYEIVICSDLKNERAKGGAAKLCRELRLQMIINSDYSSINGIKSYVWSENKQTELMQQCKAAIDIKSNIHFSQNHKPPTKAQKYISSGIPFAVNKESYSYEYFFSRGLQIPEPNDVEKLFSFEYWQEVQSFGKILKKNINISNIAMRFKDIYENS